ncbi:MAG TPA: outer membrane lipoprotein-sorting protein [archaeon]|nr:outer membrane lipoprotein-sorting protein [archaeon]
MKLVIKTLIFFLICIFNYSSAETVVNDTTLARRIVEHADTLMRGTSNYGVYRMTVVRPDWSRSMTMESWEKKEADVSFIEVIEPPKEAGTAFLKREGQMWNWLPDIERTIKIPPSMMMDSWMGSDFTNDDLVHESSIINDYSHAILGADTLDGVLSYGVQLTPKPDTPVVWDRIVIWVGADNFMPLKEEYYDEKGRLIRTMYLKNVRKISGREFPTLWILEPHLKPGQRTEFEILKIEINVEIPDRIFTRQHLERSR